MFLAAAALLQGAYPQLQAQSTLTLTPPMGWNSWNHFDTKVTDADVRGAADAIVSSGMKDAGYIYVNIDGGWQGTRDSNGTIRPNDKFPDMKALADYVHSKGLKLGIYSSPGPKDCAKFEGSYGHEEQDAATFAAWGIDYLKYDLCSFSDVMREQSHGDDQAGMKIMRAAYEKMHQALLKTGRPIVYSLCQYGWDDVWKWGPSVGGNTWRTTIDINDSWAQMTVLGFQQAGLAKFASPGHWNDPDMLEIGNGHMTTAEYCVHMTLWALLAAPLLAGNDLSHMTPDTLALLTNHEVIAIDQDPLGLQGDRVSAVGPVEVWSRRLVNGDIAVGLFNRGESETTMHFRPSDVGASGEVYLRDLWQHKDLGVLEQTYSTIVPRHGVVALRLTHKPGAVIHPSQGF
jgi:alpha-galactosidase